MCQECLASLPLAGSQRLVCQFQDIGLRLGNELEMINSGSGNIVIAVKGCRVAMGWQRPTRSWAVS
ncbi:hypothetical protein DFAR_1550007 [Desulfarculales bacterium]